LFWLPLPIYVQDGIFVQEDHHLRAG